MKWATSNVDGKLVRVLDESDPTKVIVRRSATPYLVDIGVLSEAEAPLVCNVYAEKIAGWIQTRGGACLWLSADLSNPGWSAWTPRWAEDGSAVGKPNWRADEAPLLILDLSEVIVYDRIEVARYHVATRLGTQGLVVKVTDGGSRRLRKLVAKARETYADAWYEFDYYSYDNAVICAATAQSSH